MPDGIKVGPSGPERARIMIVGEAPGADEERLGLPFVGKSGQLLRDFLMQSGIDPSEVFFTNICRYRPPKNRLTDWFTNGMPNQTVLEGMLELVKEIQRVKPNVILACGNYPMWALTGKGTWNPKRNDLNQIIGYSGIHKWRGSILECTMVEGCKVIPSFHPSYILQEGYEDHATWLCDLQRVAREAAFPELRLPKKDIVIDPRGVKRFETTERLLGDKSRKVLTFDIEYVNNKLLCVGMTTHRDEAHVIVIRNPSDLKYCKDILESGIGLNAQNSIFDVSILEWNYQMQLMDKLVYDTMLAQHAACIEYPKSLDYLISIYTDQRYHKDMVDWKAISSGKQSIDDVWQYNGIDTWTQHEIMEEQTKFDLSEADVRETFEFEMQLIKPLWDVSKRGIRLDLPAIQALDDTLTKEIIQMQAVLDAIAGWSVNVASTPQVAKLLFDQLGMKPVKVNPTGPATDDRTLAQLHARSSDELHRAILDTIRNIRTRRNLKSKFTEMEFDEDGRFRSQYNPAGTDTGRLASQKFVPTGKGSNGQNQPRDKRVRRVYLPDRGKSYGYADLERAESLVVSYITNDPEMLRVHGPGVDAHKELASILVKKPVDEVDDDERYLGKRTRHAGNYMQGPKRFEQEVNKDTNKTGVSITYGEAQAYIKIYRSIHEYLPVWWKEVENQLWKNRTLRNMLGRKRVFHGHLGQILPNAVAFEPQSTVGDALNVALLNLEGVETQYMRRMFDEAARARKREMALYLKHDCGFEILQQIHDAVSFQYYEGMESAVLPVVNDLMQIPLVEPRRRTEFTIPVEVMTGPNWGDVKARKVEALVA